MAPRLVGGISSSSSKIRLLSGYPESVTDAGLISVMFGEDSERVGQIVLEAYPAPDALWRVNAEDLIDLPGVGPSKAARLLACLEMSRRIGVWRPSSKPVISTPRDVVNLCWPQLRGSDRERFWALALGTKNHLIKTMEVSVGSLNASIVHPRELFKDAVRISAASIVVVHNHPSGDPAPSSADIQLTRRLVKAGDVLGIDVLDHVVIGDNGEYSSLKELGLM